MREGIIRNINKGHIECFPLVGQRKQTNHCKLTMVWWENDISFLFGLLQKLRVGRRSRDSVSLQSRLLAEKSFLDESRSERLIFLETQKTEVRVGVVED